MAAARSIGSVTLRFNVVAIPAKIFTAQSEKKVSFNRIVKATGARVKQQLLEEASGRPVSWEDLVPGYEYELGKFVTFTKEELKSIEAEANPDEIRIREVVPLSSVDSRHLGKAQYLGPDKGGDYSFALVNLMLASRGLAAVGQRGGQTRDELIIIRAQEHGLVMHEGLYADEVRSLAETITAATFTFGAEELSSRAGSSTASRCLRSWPRGSRTAAPRASRPQSTRRSPARRS